MDEQEKKDGLAENESLISSDDVEIEVAVSSDEPVVYVKFSNFEDYEDAEEYAEFLAETLPLLLFETRRIQ
jgi:SepF-like predicted cell division protein (DUF552 family)